MTTFYQKVKQYEKLPDAIEQFRNTRTNQVEEYPIPRVRVVLENGTELTLQEQGHSPRWSFSVRSDAKPNSLGAKYWKEAGIINSVELSGSQQDYDAFQKALYDDR